MNRSNFETVYLYLSILKYISFGLRFDLSFEICYADMVICYFLFINTMYIGFWLFLC